MSSFASAIKAEIQRLARKEIKDHLQVTRRMTLQHRHDIAVLKRQLKDLERTNRALKRSSTSAVARDVKGNDEAEAKPRRFSAKGLVSLRARLELSALELGRLLGVSAQSIYNWEQQKAVPRAPQIAAIAALRGRGKRDVRAELDAAG